MSSVSSSKNPKLLHCFYTVHSNLLNHFCLWLVVYQYLCWNFSCFNLFSLFLYSLFIFLGICLLLYFITGRAWVLALPAVVTFPCHTSWDVLENLQLFRTGNFHSHKVMRAFAEYCWYCCRYWNILWRLIWVVELQKGIWKCCFRSIRWTEGWGSTTWILQANVKEELASLHSKACHYCTITAVKLSSF